RAPALGPDVDGVGAHDLPRSAPPAPGARVREGELAEALRHDEGRGSALPARVGETQPGGGARGPAGGRAGGGRPTPLRPGAGWGASVVGLLYILFMARSQHRWRVPLFSAVMAAAVTPLALDESVSGRLSDRAASFTDLSSDRSLNARADLYSMAATQLLYIP